MNLLNIIKQQSDLDQYLLKEAIDVFIKFVNY